MLSYMQDLVMKYFCWPDTVVINSFLRAQLVPACYVIKELVHTLAVLDALGKFGEHLESYNCSRFVPQATLTLLSCSPNFPRASIARYRYAKHGPILYYYWYTSPTSLLKTQCSKKISKPWEKKLDDVV